MAEPVGREERNGGAGRARVPAGNGQIPNDTPLNNPAQNINQPQQPNVNMEERPLGLDAQLPRAVNRGGIGPIVILKYIAGTIIVTGLFAICLYIQREYYINQLLKHAPSPSPFSSDDAPSRTKTMEEEQPESDVISLKYKPPSEVLQKIPFLRKTEDEIYADQMKQVMWNLREAVKRMDRGGNETQLAGVITMKPNTNELNEVNVKGLEDLEGISEDIDPESDSEFDSESNGETKAPTSKNIVTDLVKRITSALTEMKAKKKGPHEADESISVEGDPVAAILNYRTKYFKRDQELCKLLEEAKKSPSPPVHLVDEFEKRVSLRRSLIIKLVDQFFKTEIDDDARIEKAYHYAMNESELEERYHRLESELFGYEDLGKGGRGGAENIFRNYRKMNGYIYDENLKTFITSTKIEKLKNMEKRERKGFYSEMKILIKLENRIKEKVIKYAKERVEL